VGSDGGEVHNLPKKRGAANKVTEKKLHPLKSLQCESFPKGRGGRAYGGEGGLQLLLPKLKRKERRPNPPPQSRRTRPLLQLEKNLHACRP